ncbi:MAG: DUF3352 domain-containing protein [Planctomycetes bacterium]|nr:DUF3352 domain-containing protein [Planctomycetota bacterium]
MKLITCIVAAVFAVGIAWSPAGAEPPDPRGTETSSPATPIGEDVLKLAPADALLILYTLDVHGALAHPVVGHLPAVVSDMGGFMKAGAATFDGPIMVAFSGVPINPMSWRFTVAARVAKSQSDFLDALENELVPAWNRFEALPGPMQVWREEHVAHLTLAGPVPLAFDVTVRDGVMLASSQPGIVEAWLGGGDLGEPFVDAEDFARLTEGLSGTTTSLLYLNARSLIPMVESSMNQLLPKLSEALQIDRVEFVGFVSTLAQRSTSVPNRAPTSKDMGHPVAAEKTRTRVERLAIGLKNIEPGLWHLIAGAPSALREAVLPKFFPAGSSLLIHGSMENASKLVDDISAIAAVIDKEIVAEYVQERAEFAREAGFDPQKGFLANLVGEWALSIPVSKRGHMLAAFRLGNAATFKTHMHRLRVVFQLETRPSTYRGVTVEQAVRKGGAFSYALVDDVLLLSPQREAIERAIDAALDGTGLNRSERFQAVTHRTVSGVSKFVFLNIEALLSEVMETGVATKFPELVKRLQARSVAGLSVTPHERMIAFDMTVGEDGSGGAVDLFAAVLMPSIDQARVQSMRAVSTSRVEGILISCLMHSHDHKKQWPRSLQELVTSGAVTAKQLSSPYQPEKATGQEPYYLYRYIPDPKSIKDRAQEVVVSEPAIHDGGAVFGFLDGHAEWVGTPRADELLKIMRR